MRATAPAVANQTGATPTIELIPKPMSVSPITLRANAGSFGGGSASGGSTGAAAWRRSSAKTRLSTTHSTAIATSHGNAMSAAKRVNDTPQAAKASRLVRLDTGSSSEALLARCEQA